MTAAKVVDASALAALLFGEPEAELIAARLDGHHLVAPSLLSFELANVCLVKCRRHPDRREALLAGLRLRVRLGVEEIAVDQDAVVELALETGLTAYDTSYLWLARHLNAEVVTLDKALDRVATAG
ncbi:MAG TPA: type II toxin-antitoxin system VapC family toxin [Caulobacteraceae bacterium]|nr:type II toxin-antitoxin system VapC family toxin [Caulobacteraceae bacterium]